MLEEIVQEPSVQEDETSTDTDTQDNQRIDWKARAIAAEALIIERKKEQKENKKINQEDSQRPQDDSRLWEVAEMIQKGYTRSDAEFIQKNGGSEALKDPNSYVSIALRTIQEQRRAEAAANATSSGAGQSEIERQYTPEQLKNMSVDELKKILPHAEPS